MHVAPEVWGGGPTGIEYASHTWNFVTSGITFTAQGPTTTTKTKPISPFACYDNVNNTLWNYSDSSRRVARWANTGKHGEYP
jgi:hypothetical protein